MAELATVSDMTQVDVDVWLDLHELARFKQWEYEDLNKETN